MIVAVGVDTVAIARIEQLWHNAGERLLQRLCTADERAYCLGRARPAAALAARFCAKEAVAKCLHSGFAAGVTLRSIEVARTPGGAVAVVLHGPAAELAARRGIRRVLLSLSHDDHRAIAFAVAEG